MFACSYVRDGRSGGEALRRETVGVILRWYDDSLYENLKSNSRIVIKKRNIIEMFKCRYVLNILNTNTAYEIKTQQT